MNPFTRTISLVAVIAVSAVSGALAGAVFDRPAAAAVTTPVQDSQLANLLKYVKVDSGGNVVIEASNVTIEGSGVSVKASASLQMIAGANVNLEGAGGMALTSGGSTAIKASNVTLCCNAVVR